MALETGTYISDLVSTNPAGTDTLDKADDHLRLIKSTVKATFPNITGAVTPTHTDLNKLTASGSPQFSTIELGNASDTTISRSAAGVIAVEGGVIPKENRANTFSASQTITTGASQALLTLDANAAVSKTILMTTATLNRWLISSENTAESGSNAGSNFIINRYNDAGTFLSTALTINRSTGNVGIGTASSAFGLTVRPHIQITNANYATLELLNDSGVQSRFISDNVNTPNRAMLGTESNHELRIRTNAQDRVIVDTSGNVGIGTTTPTDGNLHIHGGSGSAALKLTNTVTGQTSVDGFYLGIEPSAGGAFIYQRENQPISFGTNNTNRVVLTANGDFIVTGSGGLGYGTGSGGTVTQVTSKATGVTLNKTNGQITTTNSAIAANGNVSFTVTNSTVAATDNIIVTKVSGGTANRYTIFVSAVAAGSFEITILNNSAASQSDVIVLNFAVIKTATA